MLFGNTNYLGALAYLGPQDNSLADRDRAGVIVDLADRDHAGVIVDLTGAPTEP